MKHIDTYLNQSAFAAATRPVAGLVAGRAQFSGVNVIRPWAERSYADAIFYDIEARERVVIKAGTIDLDELDQSRYINLQHAYIGHVYGLEFALGAQLAARMFATGDEWTVSGIDFSTAGSVTLRFRYYNAAAANTKELTYEWEAGQGSVAAWVAAINAATGIKSYCTAIAIDETSFGVVVNGYNSGQGITLVSGDVTLERTHQGYQYRNYPGALASTNIYRKNGTGTTSAYVNLPRYTIYIATNGADATDAAFEDAVIKRSRFNATDNPALYAQFGGSYEAYVAADYELRTRADYPINRGALYTMASGKEETDLLGNVHHTRFDGVEVWDFPLHRAALTVIGVDIDGHTTGFEVGGGHLPGLAEMMLIMRDVKTDQSDILNETLGAIGTTKMSNGTTYRLAFQSNAAGAWVYDGTGGILNPNLARITSNASRVLRAL